MWSRKPNYFILPQTFSQTHTRFREMSTQKTVRVMEYFDWEENRKVLHSIACYVRLEYYNQACSYRLVMLLVMMYNTSMKYYTALKQNNY